MPTVFKDGRRFQHNGHVLFFYFNAIPTCSTGVSDRVFSGYLNIMRPVQSRRMNMRMVIVASTLLGLLSQTLFAQNESIRVGGATRTFITYKPSGLPDHPPLVVSMHGLGGSGSFQRQMYPMDKIADTEKFIVVYPDGVDKSEGAAGWDIKTDSDVNFISDLIDSMISKNHVDSNRVFATGFSMGGMMSYKLACTITDKIAAIGPASGYPWDRLNPENCSPTRPVPVCHTHGMTDNVVAYSGLQTYVNRWIGFNGCTEKPETTTPTAKYRKIHYSGCEDGSEIVLYLFEGMGHAYPTVSSQGFSPSDTIWQFFKAHPKHNVVAVSRAGIHPAPAAVVTVTVNEGVCRIACGKGISSVRLFNAQGRKVFTSAVSASSVSSVDVPAGTVSRGVYFVRVVSGVGVLSARVVIP